MGGHQDIVHVEQGIVRRRWLIFQDIETRAKNLLRFERSDQRRLIHDRATTGIDEHRRRLHQAEFPVTDHTFGTTIERHMQRNNVCGTQQLVERHPANV